MKPVKYTSSDTNLIDLGTKKIYKYPTPTKEMDLGKMVVNGRHPVEPNTYFIEHVCSFVLYVTKGNGMVYAGDETFELGVGDVVFVPKNNKYAVEGNFEYITFDSPAFFPEQVEDLKA